MLAAVAATMIALSGCQPADDPTDDGSNGETQTSGVPQTEDETVEETSAEDGQETTDDAPEAPEDTGTSEDTEATADIDDTDITDAGPPWTTDFSEVGAATIGDAQEITGVRTGTHDGFDRVVLDLTGDEVGLGWYAAFTDQVFHDPTGEPLDVAGQTYLQLGVRGIDWIVDSPERYAGDPVPGGGTVVEEVVFGGLFEGQQQIVLGLTEQTAYRVFALSDPSRIVIDVQHP